jgi:hypothetical protein
MAPTADLSSPISGTPINRSLSDPMFLSNKLFVKRFDDTTWYLHASKVLYNDNFDRVQVQPIEYNILPTQARSARATYTSSKDCLHGIPVNNVVWGFKFARPACTVVCCVCERSYSTWVHEYVRKFVQGWAYCRVLLAASVKSTNGTSSTAVYSYLKAQLYYA